MNFLFICLIVFIGMAYGSENYKIRKEMNTKK